MPPLHEEFSWILPPNHVHTHLCKCVCCSSFVKSIHAGNHLWGVGKFSYDCVSKQPLLRLYDYRRFERNSLEDERHSWLLLLHYRLTVILNYVCKIRISKCQEGAQWVEVISKGAFQKWVFWSFFLFQPTTEAYPEMSGGLKFRKKLWGIHWFVFWFLATCGLTGQQWFFFQYC